MMSVGLSASSAAKLLESTFPLTKRRVDVACRNSPSNVTLSGDTEQVDALALILERDQVFHRKLKANIAYHASQMEKVTKD